MHPSSSSICARAGGVVLLPHEQQRAKFLFECYVLAHNAGYDGGDDDGGRAYRAGALMLWKTVLDEESTLVQTAVLTEVAMLRIMQELR